MRPRPVRVWITTADGYWFDFLQVRPGVWEHRHLPDLDAPRVWAQVQARRVFRRYITVPLVVPSLPDRFVAGDTLTLTDLNFNTEYL